MGLPSVCLHALPTSKQNVAVAVTLQCVLGLGVFSKSKRQTDM